MSPSREKRLMIAAIVYPVAQSFLFGSAVVLAATGFPDAFGTLLPYAVMFSLVLAAPLSWEVAPALSLELSGRDRQSRHRQGMR